METTNTDARKNAIAYCFSVLLFPLIFGVFTEHFLVCLLPNTHEYKVGFTKVSVIVLDTFTKLNFYLCATVIANWRPCVTSIKARVFLFYIFVILSGINIIPIGFLDNDNIE